MPVELTERISASDAALAARVACGDAAALTPLYQRYRGPVYRFALLWSGAPAMAADVTQDVFIHLLARAGDYDAARGPLLPWLLGIARNFVHKRAGVDARNVRVEEELDDTEAIEPAHDEAIDSRREIDRLRRAIAALPPHYRDVLVLVELAERSYAEAAAICGCELNTVRSRLFRARALVAQALRASSDNARIARG
jgi:RNA polymerase sigma-70 factor (ECF subfamily)